MNIIFKRAIYLVLAAALSHATSGQGIQMGEIIILNYPVAKSDGSKDALRKFLQEDITPAPNRGRQADFHLFQADRGNRNGEYLIVCNLNKAEHRRSLPAGSPFRDEVLTSRSKRKASDILANQNDFTEYHLLGADKFESLPQAEILGIHYLKVRDTRAADFENFVVEKMHPAVTTFLPDMHLLTYKATDGVAKGSYITIFAIKSLQARDDYWPAGKPETTKLKEAFQPLKNLAAELREYLVSGSYLEPSGGAAAIFESKEWTDFIYVKSPDQQQK